MQTICRIPALRFGEEQSRYFGKAGFGVGEVGSVENRADVCGDFLPEIEAGHVCLAVLLEMELAALPGRGGMRLRQMNQQRTGAFKASPMIRRALGILEGAITRYFVS